MDDAFTATTDGEGAALGQASMAGATMSRDDAEALVLRVIASDAESVLRLARRHSMCADDAQDAYQRGLEIFMRHAARLDPERAGAWLHTVVKHEAMAVRRSRAHLVAMDEVDFDSHVSDADSPEDQALRFERVARSAEALQRLKPQEVRALWLKALGNSYDEIARSENWSYTKVNRCIAEGRRSFLKRYAGIEAGEECQRWATVLSAIVDGEATAQQVLDVRPHLRNCPGCRASVREMRQGTVALSGVLPLAPVVAFADTPITGGGGILARIYEAVAGGFHDRAAASAVKLQTALDAASVGKVAAVAASAAAVAGGGVAAAERADGQPERSSPARTAHLRTATASVTASPPVTHAASATSRPSPLPVRRSRRLRPAASQPTHAEFQPSKPRSAPQEFAGPPEAVAATPSPAPARIPAPLATSGGSFERASATTTSSHPSHSAGEFGP